MSTERTPEYYELAKHLHDALYPDEAARREDRMTWPPVIWNLTRGLIDAGYTKQAPQ